VCKYVTGVQCAGVHVRRVGIVCRCLHRPVRTVQACNVNVNNVKVLQVSLCVFAEELLVFAAHCVLDDSL
jgi:hypothetical protein